MSQPCHISSLVVTVRPDALGAVTTEIASFSQADVALTDPKGKIIVALETEGEGPILDFIDTIQVMKGVVNTALVYHQVDDSLSPAAPAKANLPQNNDKTGDRHG